jgi:uncharacterized protein (DUF305 family)
MLLRKIFLVSLISMGFITSGVIATAQSPTQPNSTTNQPTRPYGMHRRGGMGSGMMQMQMQMNSEFDYLSQMIPHHQEAIDTARIVLEQSNRPEMKEFAQDIIDVQSAEIEQMQAWLGEWYSGQESTHDYTTMMRELNDVEADQLDQAFLEDMIMHHHMAVMMSRMLVNHGLVEHEAVRPFAEQIASSQMNEIHQMRAWLYEWYGTTGMMPGMMRGM